LLFFTHWYCENGLPLELISDRDHLFVSRFWRALTKLTGVKHAMSTSYHPETDGSSERTNRTLIQALRYHVQQNQTGWARALPIVRFNYMSTVNESTGFTPFQLRLGRSPRMIPPVSAAAEQSVKDLSGPDGTLAADVIRRVTTDELEAQDNLLLAKTKQTFQANAHRGDELVYRVGDKVLLSTFHRRRDYMRKGDHRVAKFMVRYDGPYVVAQAWPDTSVYTLDLPPHMSIFPTFHASLLRPWRENDDSLFPGRAHEEPGPIATPDGPEHVVDRILDRRRWGRGYRYLVSWKGYGPEHNRWLPGSEVNDLRQLDDYLYENHLDGVSADYVPASTPDPS
jgi:hypothetical protein